jgi:hypothetical protein
MGGAAGGKLAGADSGFSATGVGVWPYNDTTAKTKRATREIMFCLALIIEHKRTAFQR